jgi:hypothetical protein
VYNLNIMGRNEKIMIGILKDKGDRQKQMDELKNRH